MATPSDITLGHQIDIFSTWAELENMPGECVHEQRKVTKFLVAEGEMASSIIQPLQNAYNIQCSEACNVEVGRTI